MIQEKHVEEEGKTKGKTKIKKDNFKILKS